MRAALLLASPRPLRIRLQPPGCTGTRGLSNRPINSPQRFLRAAFKPKAQARRPGVAAALGLGGRRATGVRLGEWAAVRGPRRVGLGQVGGSGRGRRGTPRALRRD